VSQTPSATRMLTARRPLQPAIWASVLQRAPPTTSAGKHSMSVMIEVNRSTALDFALHVTFAGRSTLQSRSAQHPWAAVSPFHQSVWVTRAAKPPGRGATSHAAAARPPAGCQQTARMRQSRSATLQSLAPAWHHRPSAPLTRSAALPRPRYAPLLPQAPTIRKHA
jgi:hypothetical protein